MMQNQFSATIQALWHKQVKLLKIILHFYAYVLCICFMHMFYAYFLCRCFMYMLGRQVDTL